MLDNFSFLFSTFIRAHIDIAMLKLIFGIFLFFRSSTTGCHLNGQNVFEEREVTLTEDPCVKCQCNGKKLTCVKKACPVLQCPSHLQYTPPGGCCKKCTKNITYTPTKGSFTCWLFLWKFYLNNPCHFQVAVSWWVISFHPLKIKRWNQTCVQRARVTMKRRCVWKRLVRC